MRRKFGWLAILGLGIGVPSLVFADQNTQQSLIVSANPVDNTPFVKNGRVEAVAKLGDRVYVAGTFTQVKNWQGSAPTLTKNYLFAYSATTGQIDAGWNPVVNSPVIDLAVAPDGSGVFAGGAFTTVNGVTRVGLVKLDPATGTTVTAFSAATGGGTGVYDMDIGGNKLYLTGTFTKVKGQTRTRLAAVNVTTGALDPEMTIALTDQSVVGTPTPWIKDHHIDVSADGTKLMVIGHFNTAGGLPRSQAALIDLTTTPDTVANWSTDKYVSFGYQTIATSVSIDPTGTFAVIVATCCPQFAGPNVTPSVLGDMAARFELAPNGLTQPTWWSATGTDTFTDVAISGTAVYVGGHFRWLNARNSSDTAGGVYRAGIAALDPDNGVAFNWNAGRDRGYGVLDSILTDDQYIIGHDTNVVGGEWHPKLAAFPLTGGIVNPPVLTPLLPVNLYSLPSVAGDVVTRSFDGAVIAAPTVTSNGDWSFVRGAFTNGQSLFAGSSDGKLYRYTFDGTTWTNPVDLTTRTDYVSGPAVSFSTVEAMGFVSKGLLFTRTGDTRLYWSGFNLESGLIGGFQEIIAGNGDGNDWSGARSIAIVGSTLYATWADGNLIALPMVGKIPAALATATVVSGPGIDGVNWTGQELVIAD